MSNRIKRILIKDNNQWKTFVPENKTELVNNMNYLSTNDFTIKLNEITSYYYSTLTTNGTFTINTSNLDLTSETNKIYSFVLFIEIDSAKTISWDSSKIKWENDVTPTFDCKGIYSLEFVSYNNCNTFIGEFKDFFSTD